MFRPAERTLHARSVALVGASEQGKWPRDIFASLRDGGFAGGVFPINPKYRELWGVPCYPDFAALPSPVEHAAVIVPAQHVIAIVEDAVRHGVKSATIYAAGVGDGTDPESIKRGHRLKEVCTSTQLIVAGPNCMGANAWREKLFLYPNTSIAKLPSGSVAVAFQSGGTMQFWVQSAGDRGVRFSYAVSTGNELDLDIADYLNFFVEDENTKIIVLFLEGIRRPDAFMAAATKALAARKPIIAIKSGRTAQSREAALSHTGAIAGDFSAYEAMCERYGIVNCRNLDDMVETALAFQAGRFPKGKRIGFVTTSGGTVDLLWDYAETEKSEFPAFGKRTVETLMPLMQEGIAPKNPLDAGIPTGIDVAARMCEAVLNDPNIDMVAWASQLPGRKSKWGDIEPMRRLLKTTDKPLVAFGRMNYQVMQEDLDAQNRIGIPFLQGLEPTLRALNGLAFYSARAGRRIKPLPTALKSDLSPENLEKTLIRYGIPLPKSVVAKSAAEAARVARRMGFSVAIKIVSQDILHKTEAGGVVLNLRTPAEVLSAAHRLSASARRYRRRARIEGYLVQEMVKGVEAIVGVRNDPLYGPLLLIGTGGIMVELVRDVAVRMLPVSTADIRSMISELKLKSLLGAFRGRPAADEAALVKAASGLAQFFLDHRESLADLEINPLMVRGKGKGAAAVDVRPVWRDRRTADR